MRATYEFTFLPPADLFYIHDNLSLFYSVDQDDRGENDRGNKRDIIGGLLSEFCGFVSNSQMVPLKVNFSLATALTISNINSRTACARRSVREEMST